MEKNQPILVRIHPNLAKGRADPLGDDIGGVGLENPTIAAQEVEDQQVWDRGAIGQAPSLDPGHPPVGDLTAEFAKHPRLADARLADEANGLAVPVFDLPKEIIQDRELILTINKSRHASGCRLAQPGAWPS